MSNADVKKINSLNSVPYYQANAQDFFDTTIRYDLSQITTLFLSYLSKGSKILDAGCGSGRDSKYFLTKGYDVVAFDGAQKLAELASKFTGLSVYHRYFSQMDEEQEYDGIWTSASLLHMPKTELFGTLEKLKKALKPKGAWYMSFRYGHGDHKEGDRYFYDQTEESLTKILEQLGGITILHMSVPDNLKSRRGFKFLVCIVRKDERK